MTDILLSDRFPRASRYNPEWLVASCSGAANPLWMTEWLAEVMQLRPGMQVLDLGCGRAASSIFLRREFGVTVWATDLWYSAAENLQRIRDAGMEDGVIPSRADARALPFKSELFDAIVSIDSFFYYGTDDLYLNYIARFLKPGGRLGIAGAGLMQELGNSIPKHFANWWTQDLWCLHSAAWWQRHWGRTGILDVEIADTLSDGWRYWRDWVRVVAPENLQEIKTIEEDAGRYLGYVRAVGRRRSDTPLMDPVDSIPSQYTKKRLLRPE